MKLARPTAVTVTPDDVVHVADMGNYSADHRLREFELYQFYEIQKLFKFAIYYEIRY